MQWCMPRVVYAVVYVVVYAVVYGVCCTVSWLLWCYCCHYPTLRGVTAVVPGNAAYLLHAILSKLTEALSGAVTKFGELLREHQANLHGKQSGDGDANNLLMIDQVRCSLFGLSLAVSLY